jgi:hypothetical protein
MTPALTRNSALTTKHPGRKAIVARLLRRQVGVREGCRPGGRTVRTPSPLLSMEPMTGIEPAYSAWEADVLPLNYIGAVAQEG